MVFDQVLIQGISLSRNGCYSLYTYEETEIEISGKTEHVLKIRMDDERRVVENRRKTYGNTQLLESLEEVSSNIDLLRVLLDLVCLELETKPVELVVESLCGLWCGHSGIGVKMRFLEEMWKKGRGEIGDFYVRGERGFC